MNTSSPTGAACCTGAASWGSKRWASLGCYLFTTVPSLPRVAHCSLIGEIFSDKCGQAHKWLRNRISKVSSPTIKKRCGCGVVK